MFLIKSSLGKWIDESCKKTALIVCERKPEINLNNIINLIKSQQKDIDSLQNELAQKSSMNSVPIGFLYTQLPNQSSPQQLWPNNKWTEITSNYSGLFFRAEGNESEPFGKIQQANQSWIQSTNAFGYLPERPNPRYSDGVREVNIGEWHWRGDGYGLDDIAFYTTRGEVRPKNTAIKIWKCIE